MIHSCILVNTVKYTNDNVDFISIFQIWYDNVPHPKLVEYKKDHNWVHKEHDYLVFPGGGTQFKDGVSNYIDFIEKV